MFLGIRDLLFGNGKQSKSLAKSRLHFVLVQDRTGLTNDEMTNFKKELMEVIAKYFVVDERGFDIDYKRDTDSTTLLINSPVVVRRQDGVHHEVGRRLGKKNGSIAGSAQDSSAAEEIATEG